jgi:hypothetical protein
MKTKIMKTLTEICEEVRCESLSTEELIEAAQTGLQLWALDTDTSGEDDTLAVSSYQEAVHCVLTHHELESLPENWSLDLLWPEPASLAGKEILANLAATYWAASEQAPADLYCPNCSDCGHPHGPMECEVPNEWDGRCAYQGGGDPVEGPPHWP